MPTHRPSICTVISLATLILALSVGSSALAEQTHDASESAAAERDDRGDNARVARSHYGGRWVLRGAVGFGLAGGAGVYGDGIRTSQGYVGPAFGSSITVGREINARWAAQGTLLGNIGFGDTKLRLDNYETDNLSLRIFGVGFGATYQARPSSLFVSAVFGGGYRRVKEAWSDPSDLDDRQPGLVAEVEGGVLLGQSHTIRNGASLAVRLFSSVGEPDREMAFAFLMNYVIEIR